MKEARFFTRLDDNACHCDLCPRGCVIKPGKRGYCLSRRNVNGSLESALYGEVAAVAIDPIEKKPLYHFMPGMPILSIGTIGCNLGCKFCQNWHLSKGRAPTQQYTPEQIIEIAQGENSKGIAYTYNEPLVWYEFVFDCCKLARQKGLKNVFVTNGYLNPEPFDELLLFIDAMNIDLKGDERFYKELTDASAAPVMRNIEKAAKSAHVEVTNLLVTGENDSAKNIQDLVDFVASVDKKIPLHFSRYFPHHKFNAPATPVKSMETALSIAREKLEFVYLGNVVSDNGRDTICPSCGNVAVSRSGYYVKVTGLSDQGRCSNCDFDLNVTPNS